MCSSRTTSVGKYDRSSVVLSSPRESYTTTAVLYSVCVMILRMCDDIDSATTCNNGHHTSCSTWNFIDIIAAPTGEYSQEYY